MPFIVSISDAQTQFSEYRFIKALTPSEQKAAFHVQDVDGADLCLKLVSPNFDSDRLSREIIALQTIKHPNVVRLLEYTHTSKPGIHRHFIVEEFVDGWDLTDRMRPGIGWDLKVAAKFFAQLFDGLAELQKHNFVHRDLKPSNIRIRPDLSPVIIDFGLARLLNMTDLTRTSDGAAIGTPRYFSPEQFSGTKHDIDHRTDFFAAGILLYEAIIGVHPFANAFGSMKDLGNAVEKSEDYLKNPRFVSLPDPWRMVASRLLEKQRARRMQSAGQVASLLRKIGGV